MLIFEKLHRKGFISNLRSTQCLPLIQNTVSNISGTLQEEILSYRLGIKHSNSNSQGRDLRFTLSRGIRGIFPLLYK